MRLDSLHVIVSGGAIGGIASALLLAREGAYVTLLERVAEPRAVGAGIALAENGWAVLESLGLAPALASAHVLSGIRVTDARGRTLLVPPEPVPRIAMVRRSTLHGALLDALAAHARIEAHFGVEVLRATPDGTVVVRSGIREDTLRGDVVVGADGVHSTVREGGQVAARVRGSGIRYVRALVPGQHSLGVEAWTGAGIFGSFGTDDGTYLYASCGTQGLRSAVTAEDLAAFRSEWRGAYPAAEALLDAIPSWDAMLVNEVLRVECAKYHDGRLVLVGDAAHAMAPNLGQGANSALVDAAVLLDSLRRAPTVGEALAAYTSRRRPAVRRVAALSARLGALSEVTHPFLRTARDRLLVPLASRLTSAEAARRVLQESPATLLEIGRA